MLAAFRRKPEPPDRVLQSDFDAALRQLGHLVEAGRVAVASDELLKRLATPPPPREGRSVDFEIVDERTDEVLLRGAAPELDLGLARRLAGAASLRLGRRLRLTYTATSIFTPPQRKEA